MTYHVGLDAFWESRYFCLKSDYISTVNFKKMDYISKMLLIKVSDGQLAGFKCHLTLD